MSKIKELIEFLRLDRRYDEHKKNNKEIDQKEVTITGIYSNLTRTVERKKFEKFNLYNRIVGILDYHEAKHFYVLPLSNKNVFYIKIPPTPDGYNYFNIETKKSEPVEDETLLIPIEIDLSTYHYFYDKEEREVVLSYENLNEVMIFDDSILFDPEKLDIETDTYTYNYSKPISTFCQFINGIIDLAKIIISPFAFSNNKKKDVRVVVKHKGTIFLIPSIYIMGDNYYLWYYYKSSSKKPFYEVNDEDVALKLEFNGKEPFLSFLNDTIFTQESFNYLDAYDKKRRVTFIEEFKQKIIAPLEKDINNSGYQSFQNAMLTLYYLTDTIVLTLSNETLWKLFEEGISRNSLTNKLSLEEENIFVKLLEAIANKETTQEAFLHRLLRKKDQKTTYLEFLYHRIHGENGITFANLVNKAWKQSRFIAPDTMQNKEFKSTDGPLMLPYQSEKILGFYFSNASVMFDEENQIAVSFKTGQYKETVNTQSRTAVPYVKEIIANYNYHPFYPIFLKNIEKQETELNLDAIVPAFFLMANANAQFWSNVMTSAEYALDIVTTFSGVGNIAKFRYLSKLVKVAEGVSTTNKLVKTANVLRYVKGAAGVVELTSGSVNLMLKITGAKDTEFGESLTKVLFYLELITLAGELTASMKLGLKKSAKEAVEASDGALRVKHPELFAELYKIIGFDNLGRKLVYIVNSEEIGSQANKVVFKIVDHNGNEIGELIRGVGTKGRSTTYKLKFSSGNRSIDLNSEIKLYNSQMAISENLPVEMGQEIIYGDINIPFEITQQYSGFGEIMLDESLAYFKNNAKFGKVDGNFGYWVKFEEYYKDYGGQSVNLKKFWEAVDSGKSYEEAAFETFTGQWAEKNGFTKVVFDPNKEVLENEVVVKFLKK